MIAGLTAGDVVLKSGKPLSVELGPGLCGSIFDGIQRPLDLIRIISDSAYIPRGINLPALNKAAQWEFRPTGLKEGDLVQEGDCFGVVEENSLFTHSIIVPPGKQGKIVSIAPAGFYSLTDVVLELEYQNKIEGLTMMHEWPVRTPRPVREKLPSNTPLCTGQRVLDCLFP